jgi:hypothetical protein
LAQAIRDPSAMDELAKYIETARAERAAADEVIFAAEVAKGTLKTLAEERAHFEDYKTRTEFGFTARRRDLDEQAEEQNQRHASLNPREDAVSRREAEVDSARKAALAHFGAAA